MNDEFQKRTYTAFAGSSLVATGPIEVVLRAVVRGGRCTEDAPPPLIFEDQTGEQIDFDLRGEESEVLAKLASHPWFLANGLVPVDAPPQTPRTGPGRPKLGVVSREVSLLPRHWAWLQSQTGGASGTLRRLVDDARKSGARREQARNLRAAVNRFMWAMTGHLPHFEEATRALFAKDDARLIGLLREWPRDLQEHIVRLLHEAATLEQEEEVPTATSA